MKITIKPSSKAKKILIISLLAIYSTYLIDYTKRSQKDFSSYFYKCGTLIEARYSSTGYRGSGGLLIKIKNRDKKSKFRITRYALKMQNELSPHIGDEICIYYIEPPIIKPIKYPIKIENNGESIVNEHHLLTQYINRKNDYIFWFIILTAYIFSLIYKFERKK